MNLITIIVVLALIGVALYLLERFVPMDATIRLIIRIVVILVVILWLLQWLVPGLRVPLPAR